MLAPLPLILKRRKVGSFRRKKSPLQTMRNRSKNRLLRVDNLRRKECEDHLLDSFVTQGEIEGFIVALDGNLQRKYEKLL